MAHILHLLFALAVVVPCVAMAWRPGAIVRRWAWGAAAAGMLLGSAWTDPLAVGLALVDGRLGGVCMTAPVP